MVLVAYILVFYYNERRKLILNNLSNKLLIQQ